MLLPEVHSYLFCFSYIELKTVAVPPVDELMYLLSVGWVVIVADEAHYSFVLPANLMMLALML